MTRGRTRADTPLVGETVVTPTGAADPVRFTDELRSTQRVATTLLRLIQRTEVEALPGGTEAVRALEEFAEVEIPTARALARAALSGGFDQNQVYILWARTRRAFHAAAPAVMDMFLSKMQDERLPFSERLLVEAMKGMGLLTQSEPTKTGERESMLTNQDVRSMTADELDRRLAEGLE